MNFLNDEKLKFNKKNFQKKCFLFFCNRAHFHSIIFFFKFVSNYSINKFQHRKADRQLLEFHPNPRSIHLCCVDGEGCEWLFFWNFQIFFFQIDLSIFSRKIVTCAVADVFRLKCRRSRLLKRLSIDWRKDSEFFKKYLVNLKNFTEKSIINYKIRTKCFFFKFF